MMLADESEARAWLERRGDFSTLAGERLEKLRSLLIEENQNQNLVSAPSLDHIWLRHFADSAQLIDYVPRETTGSWLDLGTGAGFPGLVIAILRPDAETVMVESRARRIDWLDRAIEALGLKNAKLYGSRLENVDDRPFCAISARAFAPLPKLLDLSARFSTAETTWLLPKGRSARQELDDLRGWNHMFHVEQSLTDPEAGVIVGKLAGRKGKRS